MMTTAERQALIAKTEARIRDDYAKRHTSFIFPHSYFQKAIHCDVEIIRTLRAVETMQAGAGR